MQKLEKILFIEDDCDIGELVSYVLRKIGKFEISHCLSGREALDKCESFAPHLVLVDMMMPEMDGVQTLTNLKKIPGYEDVPAIFMTAKAQTHEQLTYQRLGAIGVIVKPCDPVELCSRIQGFWQKHLDSRSQAETQGVSS